MKEIKEEVIVMNFEVKPVGSVYGKGEEVVCIDKDLKSINVQTTSELTFAIVICMTCESHQNKIKKKLVVPNVKTHEDAYRKAGEQHKLSGEWCSQVGITLFKSNEDLIIPANWEKCEVQFHNGERV